MIFTFSQVFLSFIAFCNTMPKPVEEYTTVYDFTQMSNTQVDAIYKPHTIDELAQIVKTADKPISIAGARYSQGGQIACPYGIMIDMSDMNRIMHLDVKNKLITVETGITWKAIQEYIDPYNLSIKAMQSYNNFSVGGSLSVNVHGRDIQYAPLITTVESIKILLHDGSMVTASRTENQELFKLAIGGYGAVGIIIEATLSLTDNIPLERSLKNLSLREYPDYFFKQIKNNPDVVFHSAYLYPPQLTDVLCYTFKKTSKPLTITQRLQNVPFLNLKDRFLQQLFIQIPETKKWRRGLEYFISDKEQVLLRNNEMSYSVESLHLSMLFTTKNILQEYFVPVENLLPFLNQMRKIIKEFNINMINISIRYLPANNESVMSFCPKESFALVCYINVPTDQAGKTAMHKWTQKIINSVIDYNGTYYLPYHLYATPSQVHKAYPNFNEFLQLKEKYDPNNKFSNNFFKKYGNSLAVKG